MAKVSGGRTNYGEAIGILMLDTKFPRIPGDVGNATTYPFPVKFKVVEGASGDRVIKQADPSLIKNFIKAAQELEAGGVRAITTSCGFCAIYQQEIAAALNVPVFASSLLQVKFAHAMLPPSKKVGIITARAQSLTERHFAGVGITDIPKVVVGMDDAEFCKTFVDGSLYLDEEQARRDMVRQAEGLVKNNPDIGAVVLECTNMPPFAKDVQDAVKLPVFDIITFINYVYSAVVRKSFVGYM